MHLNKSYKELHIVVGEVGAVNQQHEMLDMLKVLFILDKALHCDDGRFDLFLSLSIGSVTGVQPDSVERSVDPEQNKHKVWVDVTSRQTAVKPWHLASLSDLKELHLNATRLPLGPDTADGDLTLSEGNGRTRRRITQRTMDLPEWFNFWIQVPYTGKLRVTTADSSWGMSCTKVWHNAVNFDVPIIPCSNRVGVYLDRRAGTVAFYSREK
ncbi:unnamed protein product [Merluccius merluccius]